MRRIAKAFKAFWAVLRKKKAKPGQLREFVYLDETSVESLLASLDGEILTGITESRSRGYELGLSATGAAPGVPAGFSPTASRSRSTTVEEQRKSVAQSAFARLRSRHYQELRLAADQAPEISARTVINPDEDLLATSLRRGDLIEVDAILGTAEVFKVQTVIDSMIGVVNSFPDLLPSNALDAVRQGEPIATLLGSLSQGLIPVEGSVVGYRHITYESRDWIVPDKVAEALVSAGAISHEVVIAGVTLSPLYWQDTRRVLFSESRYRVLGRLVHDGVRAGWSAVKVTDVLKSVNPELGRTIDSLGPMFLRALQNGEEQGDHSVDPSSMTEPFLSYAEDLAEVAGLNWTPALKELIIDKLQQHPGEARNAEEWREKLKVVDNAVFSETANLVAPNALVTLRSRHPLMATAHEPTASAVSPVPCSRESTDRARTYLELEIIAIYW